MLWSLHVFHLCHDNVEIFTKRSYELKIWIEVCVVISWSSVHDRINRFSLATDVINGILVEKFLLLLNRIFQKLHLKVIILTLFGNV